MFEPDPPALAPTPRLAAGLALAFAAVLAVGLGRHEMWLDELQAWTIAFRAASPADLLARMAYEGHPPLWHLALWGAGGLWGDPRAMQVVAWLAATATVFLLAWRSPFTPLQKALFAVGYYPLFEYGMVARGYGLGMALLAAFAAMRWSGVRSRVALALPLGLLALTSLFGLIVAWGLALVLALDAWDDDADRRSDADLAGGALLFAGLSALALKLMVPPADATFAASWRWGHDGWATSSVIGLWRAFFPVPAWGDRQPWNTNLLQPDLIPVEFQLSGLLFLLLGMALRRSPAALLGWLAASAVMLVFTWLRWGEAMRHAGHYFLLWLACLWIARPARGRLARAAEAVVAPWRGAPAPHPHVAGPLLAFGAVALGMMGTGIRAIQYMAAYLVALVLASLRGLVPGLGRLWAVADALRPGGFMLSVVLTVQAGVGLRFYAMDLQGPFSAGKALADAVAALPDGRGPLFVADTRYVNTLGPVLAAYLDREVSYLSPTRRHDGRWLVWSADRPPGFEAAPALPDVLARLTAELEPGGRALLATETPVAAFPPRLRAEIVAMAGGSMQHDEPAIYHVYRVRRVR